jgi:Tol biopolymer transport system component
LRQRFRPGFWLLLFSMIAMSACQEQINFPAPTITLVGICPSQASTTGCVNSIAAGSAQSYLTVRGTNLIQETQAGFSLTPGGSPTGLALNQYISTNELIVTLPASLLENPNTLYITVSTPQPGGGVFPAQNQAPPAATIFTITPVASGKPVVTSMNPSSAIAGASGLLLNLTGSNFVTQSTVLVNNATRTSTFLNSTSLDVDLDSSDLLTPGPVPIQVVNPLPGGGGSTPVSLNVLTAVPAITAITPTSALAGAVSASLSITGTGFLNQYSFVQVNGSSQTATTTIGGSTSATASLTAGDLVSAGVNQITVVNKPPGGGTSNIVTYSINPTHLLGLPVLVDLQADGSQAINGICGGTANCASGALGLTTTTSGPSSSSSGQFVAFASVSAKLVLTDLNTNPDVYVRNTCLALASCVPVTAVVSSDPNGNAANGPSSEPTLDSAGTHAAFTSLATNLVSTVPVQNGTTQVYWRPVCMPTTTAPCAISPSSNFDTQLVSISADGQTAGNGPSSNPVISPDGEYVAFVSTATNLVTNITADGHTPQIYIRDTCDISTIVTTAPTNACVPTTYLVSTPDGVTFGNGASSNPSISETGLFVSFTSAATNLGSTAPNPNGLPEVFERGTCITTITSTTNTCVSVTTLISSPDGTTPADGPSGQSTLSACGSVTTTTSSVCTDTTVANGRFVAFASTASNLVAGVGPSQPQQIYIRDTCLGVTIVVAQCTPSTTLVSTPDGITPANALSEHPSASSSGQFIAFSSLASNLGGSVNGVENVFVRNTCLGVIPTCTTGVALASISGSTGASPANGGSLVPSISADGHTVSFLSTASNLVSRDTNGFEDIFLGSTTF